MKSLSKNKLQQLDQQWQTELKQLLKNSEPASYDWHHEQDKLSHTLQTFLWVQAAKQLSDGHGRLLLIDNLDELMSKNNDFNQYFAQAFNYLNGKIVVDDYGEGSDFVALQTDQIVDRLEQAGLVTMTPLNQGYPDGCTSLDVVESLVLI